VYDKGLRSVMISLEVCYSKGFRSGLIMFRFLVFYSKG